MCIGLYDISKDCNFGRVPYGPKSHVIKEIKYYTGLDYGSQVGFDAYINKVYFNEWYKH